MYSGIKIRFPNAGHAKQELIDRYGVDPDKVESAIDLADDYERRMRFQADVHPFTPTKINALLQPDT